LTVGSSFDNIVVNNTEKEEFLGEKGGKYV
jgi:hypothetical protein